MSKIMVDEYGTLLYNEWSKKIIKSVLKADYLQETINNNSI